MTAPSTDAHAPNVTHEPGAGADPCRPPNLPLRQRPFDWFFIVVFTLFTVTSMISDMLPTLGMDFSQPSPNFLVNSNWWYAHDTDPLFMDPPVWMRIVTGLSAFVYPVFYVLLVVSLFRGWNWIQLPSVIYATMIATITGVIVFGVEFFGEPEWITPNPVKFLAFNLPYVLIPILLLVRMRTPLPFARRF
ncbi:EXPERA domain-containing protein [Agromyces sp. NPDC057865]|uniref:EXPERA domain-containing protein n=1 Tax=Agromyces sp. NPDC057865 TaxID=3346267 RepID=UPI00366A713A